MQVDGDTFELAGASAGENVRCVVYLIDAPEHPLDKVEELCPRHGALVRVPIGAWGDALTPWPAPGLHVDAPAFTGGAPGTLARLLEQIPAFEARASIVPARRALVGYSLAGLFALYAFAQSEVFDACASVSGSVWYPGWVAYLRDASFIGAGRFAFLSVGKRERRSGPVIFRTVEDDMAACAEALRAHGCAVETSIGPGNHLQHQRERIACALNAIGRWSCE